MSISTKERIGTERRTGSARVETCKSVRRDLLAAVARENGVELAFPRSLRMEIKYYNSTNVMWLQPWFRSMTISRGKGVEVSEVTSKTSVLERWKGNVGRTMHMLHCLHPWLILHIGKISVSAGERAVKRQARTHANSTKRS